MTWSNRVRRGRVTSNRWEPMRPIVRMLLSLWVCLSTTGTAQSIFPQITRPAADAQTLGTPGMVDSRAAVALRVDRARTRFVLDGTGQKIGILSDSFARTAGVRDTDTSPAPGIAGTLTGSRPQDSGDLPATVELRRDDQEDGTDEGAAMAELIHDIAPGAAIAFHSTSSEAVFAEGVTDLCRTAGATVVVDDILYPVEPMYQEGIIAQAAADCVAAGVPYFASAGNFANRGFRQLFVDRAQPDDTALPPTGNDLHNWGGGDGFLDVRVPAGGSITVVLQWNQPFASVSPGAGAQIDLDLYITPTPNAAGLANPLAQSIAFQGTTGAPAGDAMEIAMFTNTSATPQRVFVAIDHFDGNQDSIPQDATTPLEFRLVFFEDGAASIIQGIPNGTSAFGGPTIYGHAMAPGVTSVAAVPWFDTASFDPSFDATAATDPEAFTSRGGPLTIQFDRTGAFVPRGSVEPDIAAVDGNNTTFFGADINLGGFAGEPDGFPNFFGTSAAAPNAAAVVALMREFAGTLTPAEINAALANTAIDIVGFRAAPGDDDVTGVGLIDAEAAISALVSHFTLTVQVVGPGDGHVTSVPAGILCGADCTETYPAGTVVTVTATPSTGSLFAGWTGGGCSGIAPCAVSLTADTTVTATLAVAQVCDHDGDVNQDGALTPGDALLAFQHFLGVAIPPLDRCQQDRANVNDPEASSITPADAQCILEAFLGLTSCLEQAR